MQGTVSQLVINRGFGFITTDDGREFFFHRSALQGVEYEELGEGTPVVFDIKEGDKGDEPGEDPRAVSIRLADNAMPAVDNDQLSYRKLGGR